MVVAGRERLTAGSTRAAATGRTTWPHLLGRGAAHPSADAARETPDPAALDAAIELIGGRSPRRAGRRCSSGCDLPEH